MMRCGLQAEKYNLRNCNCRQRGRICVCVPRGDIDSMMIHVINESRRLRVLHELRTELDRDLLGVDVKWVLFGMAVQSYRYEQLVVPYPPTYATPNGLNINALSFMVGTMADLMEFQRRLLQKVLPPEQVQLLHWLLIQSNTPRILQVPRSEHSLLWRQLEYRPDPLPHLIFRVEPRCRGGGEEMQSIESLDVDNCVYYCGDMEELFSLINGESFDITNPKLEFYSDLEQACNMAEWCPGWGYSICGTLLRCVAICQVDHQSAQQGPVEQEPADQLPAEHSRPVKHLKPVKQQKPSEQPKPSEQQEPAEQRKPEEQKESAEQQKPAEQPKLEEQQEPPEQAKPVEQQEPAEQPKPEEQKESAEQQKPAEQPKLEEQLEPPEQPKPEEQQEQAEQSKPVDQQEPPVQPKPAKQQQQKQQRIPQRYQVRYLLIYSMSYSQKMQGVRRRQWKKIQQRQLQKQQLEQELDKQVAEMEQLMRQEGEWGMSRKKAKESHPGQDRSSEKSKKRSKRPEKDTDKKLSVCPKMPTLDWLFTNRFSLMAVGALTAASLILMATKIHRLHQ